MSQDFKSSGFGILIPILLGLVIAKFGWVVVELLKLPKEGVNLEHSGNLKPLYYHYSLASKKELPKVIAKKPKVIKKAPPKPKPQKITKFILKGIFASSDKKLIVLEYLNKSYVLALGESLQGYKFVKLYPTYAIFSKDGKEYKLELYKDKKNKHITHRTTSSYTPSQTKSVKKAIVREGDTTYISKNLFNKYRRNFNLIQKNIAVVPNMVGGKLKGFKIRFVRKGSDFDKLGVQRGDIILSINGEPLNNFKVPLEFFNNLDSITAATITIKRGDEIKELEYEVR